MNEKETLQIEIATLEDEPIVNKILSASFSSLLTSKYDDTSVTTILPKVTKTNPTLLQSGTYYIAKNPDGRYLGCGGWTHERPGTNERTAGLAHIRHFATHPNFIRRNVGKALFNHCRDEASKENVSVFECYSTLNAEFFYKSLGFKTIRIFELDMGDGLMFPSVLMRADI